MSIIKNTKRGLMEKKIILNFDKKEISIKVHIIKGMEKYSGLMFAKKQRAKALLFEFDKPVKLAIHSFFVFFPFIAIWIDENDKLIEIKRVAPFSFYVRPKKKFKSFVEIPFNKRYNKVLVDIERFKYN